MTRREKTLTAAVAATGVLWGATRGWTAYRDAVAMDDGVQMAAEEKLADVEFAVARGRQARHKIANWLEQSLPTNREIAESLYQDWLRGQLAEAGITVSHLADRSLRQSAAAYEEISIEVRAEGSLAQFTDFLCRFYSAGILHRISDATLSTAPGSDRLAATLLVDALILRRCPRADKLPAAKKVELARTADAYRKSIVDRNLFAPYKPPTAGNSGEAAALVTGMIYGSRGWRLDVRTPDSQQVKHFYRGDRIQVGKFDGKLVEVDGRRAVIKTSSGPMEVRLGQKLADAQKVDRPGA